MLSASNINRLVLLLAVARAVLWCFNRVPVVENTQVAGQVLEMQASIESQRPSN